MYVNSGDPGPALFACVLSKRTLGIYGLMGENYVGNKPLIKNHTKINFCMTMQT